MINRRILGRGASAAGLAATCVVLLTGMSSAGTGWQVSTMPDPSGATSIVPESVSCPAADDCTGVGIYHDHGNHTLAEHWNGTGWTVETMPSLPKDFRNPLEVAVSCASVTSCVATTWSSPPSIGGTASLTERWNGKSWSIQQIPAPLGGKKPTLNDISCFSPANCTAVGSFANSKSIELPLAEHWDGTTWTAQTPPLPANINFGQLINVSCPTARHCTAVGNYSQFNQAQGLIAEQWNGRTWTVQKPPLPAGSAFILNDVSCWAAPACIAVGTSYNSSSTAQASIVERWNGTSWALQADAAPAQSILSGVSCLSARSCTAVGGIWTGNVSQSRVVAESWNGTTWTNATLPLPSGAKSSGLSQVSCTEPAACIAVGNVEPGNPDNGITEQER
jgi:hypothetical protein